MKIYFKYANKLIFFDPEDIKKGDKILLKLAQEFITPYISMKSWCGTIVTIDYYNDKLFGIKEDKGRHLWTKRRIEINYSNIKYENKF